jgi:hypothetical protein
MVARLRMGLDGAGSEQDGTERGRAVAARWEWRRSAEDQQIDSVPAHLREASAITALKVSATFELGARVRERMAARSTPDRGYHRSRAGWNRAVARFEREQADALRAGRLLPTPWRLVPGQAHGCGRKPA